MPTPDDAAPKLVLLVDDDEDILAVASAALELVNGFRTVTASSGLDALRKAAEHRPDGIVLDVMMPGMDGLQTVARLKADAAIAHIPVILLTAQVDGENPVDTVAGVIAKPFDPMGLGAEVCRILGWEA